MSEAIDPGTPAAVNGNPSGSYRRNAWLAVATLALFLLTYFGLAAWFGVTAWRLTLGSTGLNLVGWLVGVCAAFLAVFMLKAVFFVKHGGGDRRIEITPEQQPELFRFLHELAEKAGAPKPHRVYVSPYVNAAVFYDLSLLNLVLPSKKNLEIGLGLVNALTLGEFRAVLAHEFGHFAQRAMAVGRWVYVAQQIAAQLVARRDKLDDFLVELSSTDVRIAWVGWVMRLVVWSIRSLVDTVFRLVLVVQRALSRQMEFDADLVAVSLTGSDALVHALHKLESADDAWNRAAGFVMGEKARGRLVPDLFQIQSQVVARMGRLLGDPHYGETPAKPAGEPAQHRVFQAGLAQPPQMWLTHPLNHDREANAKRRYVAAPIDGRPAWLLFQDAQALRESVTTLLRGEAPAEAKPHEDPLAELDRQYERLHLDGRYRGVYFGRPATRHAEELRALYDAPAAPSAETLAALYPATLAADMEARRSLQKEQAQLQGLQDGQVQAPGGVIQHRGRVLPRAGLGAAIAEVTQELDAVEQRLQAHDRRCRSAHLAAAQALGGGWADYLRGLLSALHYAEHVEADLHDLQGLLANTVAMATATRKVSSAGAETIALHANALHRALRAVFSDAPGLRLDSSLLKRLEVESWAAALGELTLPPASTANLGDWLGASGSWVDHTAGACAALRTQALEQLLLSEAQVAAQWQQGAAAEPAPAATVVPAGFARLATGVERPRQTRLGWWGRFQIADGWLPALARLGVAGGIVGAVLGLGGSVGSVTLHVYNGLARPVQVQFGKAGGVTVPPAGAATLDVDAGQTLRVETRTVDGVLIESFDAELRDSFGHFAYNVAGAAPLVEWTATYGVRTAEPRTPMGTPRWSSTGADVIFAEPPSSVRTQGGGATRRVLSAAGNASPATQVDLLPDANARSALAAVHARWDPLDSADIMTWIWLARDAPGFAALLQQRLAEAPGNVMLLRWTQDLGDLASRQAACRRDTERAAQAPQDSSLQYLAARCQPEGPQRDRAFVDGFARFPADGWFAYAASAVAAGHAQWAQAMAAAETALRQQPALAQEIAYELARMRRLLGRSELGDLAARSASLRHTLALESGAVPEGPIGQAYGDLARGELSGALRRLPQGAEEEVRLLRLVAASEGAPQGLVDRALALDAARGVDESTLWASVGLALRTRRDTAPFDGAMERAADSHAPAMRRFVAGLREGAAPGRLEPLLDGLTPELRGQACSMATIVLGPRTPLAWREAAKRLLFVPERPYFK